ncbi:tellurite resistance TerB family protein [Marinigracilibium pacificum]|uniref:TerB family tellurite resistance protein n=1 Tax=Marinigracilibium pacificum TaxID=2729599 RepID=A0A848IYK1_9BACT|nr:TerB family tellurite resistance protein [Marinigracilibium pacificum]NMM49357.1 TerB family tellurite resistance protein [Marinigracilibium pacificum]
MIPAHIKILIQLAKADGHIHDKERGIIERIAARHNVDESEMNRFFEEVNTEDTLPDKQLLSKDQKIEYLYDIIALMKADGKLERSEVNYCLRVTKWLGYDESVFFNFVTTIYMQPHLLEDKESLKETINGYLNEI